MSKNTTTVTNTPGRNDPCPCGSGRKYKKCHGTSTSGNSVAVGSDQFERAHTLFEQGHLNDALNVCLSIISINPLGPDALQLAGIIELQFGLMENAERHLKAAVKIQPKNPWIHSNLCQLLMNNLQLDEAASHGEKAISLDPDMAGAWNNLGNVYRAQNNLEQAIKAYTRALDLFGPYSEVQCNIGIVLEKMGEKHKAEERYRKVLKADPNFARAYMLIGELLLENGNFDKALNNFNRSLELVPQQTDAHCSLGYALLERGRFEEAKDHFLAALSVDDKDVNSILGFSSWLEKQEQWQLALDTVERAIKASPHSPLAVRRKSYIFSKMHQYLDALRVAELEVENDSNNVSAQINLAAIHQKNGEFDIAREIYAGTIQFAHDPKEVYGPWAAMEEKTNHIKAARLYVEKVIELDEENQDANLLLARIARREKDFENSQRLLDKINTDESCATKFCTSVLFERANLLDKQGEYDKAFQAYQSAAKARARMKNLFFDANDNKLEVERHIKFYTRSQLHSWPQCQPDSKSELAKPVFILGFPRTGTTLLEQILCSHPSIYAGGELPFLSEIIERAAQDVDSSEEYPLCLAKLTRKNGPDVLKRWLEYYHERVREYGIETSTAQWFTDKMPLNSRNLPLIRSLFPDSPIIHIVRNPMDSCLSSMFSNFASGHVWANDIVDAAKFHMGVESMVDNFRENLEMNYLMLRYEDLVADQEKWSRIAIDFIGVDWNDDVLEFYKTKRVARTASYAQVNQKIYTSSVARYKNYEKHLAEPLEILRPMMQRYGYLDD